MNCLGAKRTQIKLLIRKSHKDLGVAQFYAIRTTTVPDSSVVDKTLSIRHFDVARLLADDKRSNRPRSEMTQWRIL